MKNFLSISDKDTKRIAENLARSRKFRLIGLTGELGAGKTTFVQGFANALGISQRVVSPTFVIMKTYPIVHPFFRRLVHIDAYRISSSDLNALHFSELKKDPTIIILIEWSERLARLRPHWILSFAHGGDLSERSITIHQK